MRIIIDIPEAEYEICKMYKMLVEHDGYYPENTNALLKLSIANGEVVNEVCKYYNDGECYGQKNAPRVNCKGMKKRCENG